MKMYAPIKEDADSALVGPLSVRGQGRAPMVGLAHCGLDDAASAALGNPSSKRSHPSDNVKVL
jgi:hypothetical protein